MRHLKIASPMDQSYKDFTAKILQAFLLVENVFHPIKMLSKIA